MKTSRQKILDFIRKQNAVTSSEISISLKMTPANARHHLKILLENGLVEIIGIRHTQGKGRPAHLYSISEQALGDNLLLLASAMLEEIKAQLAPSEFELFLNGLADRINEKITTHDSRLETRGKELHLTQRLFDTVQHLNNWRYQAHWEAHLTAPLIILSHCPYANMPEKFPEICQLEALLLENLLGRKVHQLAKLKPDDRGMKNCIFQLS